MKIDKQVREAYQFQHTQCEALGVEVEKIIKSLIHQRWHYESRLKSSESFALKIEAGHFKKKLVIDDFFACTIVVANNGEIAKAIKLIGSAFELVYRRPKDDSKTTISPTDFRFDDLRLYFRLRPLDYLPETAIHKIIFEIQIKTFLQHAWAIATHDLTYKTDAVSWAKTRIAHQIRAMLEHAELSIEQVETLATSTLVAKEFADFTEITDIINTLKKYWSPERLPRDLLRLAQNTRYALQAFSINLADFDLKLADETQAGRGAKLENLSPYGSIMQTILNSFSKNVSDAKAPERKITISGEVELPPALGALDRHIFRVI